MTRHPITLVGDGIENPWNARTMIEAAAMFGGPCVFRDRRDLVSSWGTTFPDRPPLRCTGLEQLAEEFAPIIAVDNLPGAASVYGFRPSHVGTPAIVVGNERHGVARDIPPIAQHAAQIPMVSRKLNCLNVAAASAVALYYLWRGGGGKQQVRVQPAKRRPELLLMGAADHVELGSSIRSAGAFGWSRLMVEDRNGAWFGRDRSIVTEGRAAARQSRNPIRVVSATSDRRFAFAQACVITLGKGGVPLHQADLARGPSQLIILPDETSIDIEREDWGRFANDVKFVHLSVPGQRFSYHYRLGTTISVAEVARQVGQQATASGRRPTRGDLDYARSLSVVDEDFGEVIYLDDLKGY